MLSTKVKTTGDLMSIALQAEREAIRRYIQLAAAMRTGNNDAAAALFERMVLEEQGHESLLLEWMAQEGISENPEIGPMSWRDPYVSTIYNEEARDPYYSSPYRALAFAVHNEDIAFRFYTHVAADSDNQAVRRYAEILAREELGHAALLRAERRHAYHAERQASLSEPRFDPEAIAQETDLLTAAIHLDQRLADEMDTLPATTAEIDKLAAKTRQHINQNTNLLAAGASPSSTIEHFLEQLDAYQAQQAKSSNSSEAQIKHLCASADRSFAFYDAIVATATDEAIMLRAQNLAATALDRIGILKQVFGDSYLPDDPDDSQSVIDA